MREIAITQIGNVKIGHAQNDRLGTGCTVLIFAEGAPAGVDVRGGGPASRETELLNPLAGPEKIHAVLFAGGSAFGLDAAGGVMRYLAERGIGYQTSSAVVPLVCASCIYDLSVGSPAAFPDQDMAYAACEDAQNNLLRQGNVGAGVGATVGKYKKDRRLMMKSGLGLYAAESGDLKIGALAVVNAFGDVYDGGKIVAGMLADGGAGFACTDEMMCRDCFGARGALAENTTLAAVVTNAAFNKPQLAKIAAMAQDGLARAISPVHTMADGDSVYALSVGGVAADINIAGTIAARVVERAILNAVQNAGSAYGLKAARDMAAPL
ncbi:MAG: P1 family peptidase [Acidaminococcales bacterium]|nr:P1 family peptidase [Acidaminococcales bacterium]